MNLRESPRKDGKVRPLKQINGNLISLARDGKFDIIVHGCNCFNTMGAGLARQIRTNFPEAYAADQRTKRGDRTKLGKYTLAKCELRNGRKIIVVNAYIQYNYGRGYGDCKDYVDMGRLKQFSPN